MSVRRRTLKWSKPWRFMISVLNIAARYELALTDEFALPDIRGHTKLGIGMKRGGARLPKLCFPQWTA